MGTLSREIGLMVLLSHSEALWPGWFLAEVCQAVGPQTSSFSCDDDSQPKDFGNHILQ